MVPWVDWRQRRPLECHSTSVIGVRPLPVLSGTNWRVGTIWSSSRSPHRDLGCTVNITLTAITSEAIHMHTQHMVPIQGAHAREENTNVPWNMYKSELSFHEQWLQSGNHPNTHQCMMMKGTNKQWSTCRAKHQIVIGMSLPMCVNKARHTSMLWVTPCI